MNEAIAVAQFAPTHNRAANLSRMRQLATDARAAGATLVVFPEYSSWFAPTLNADWIRNAQPLESFARDLGAIAAELGIHLVAGMVESLGELAPGQRASNTLVAVDPEGHLVATYRKLHLYDAFGARESDWIAAGAIEQPQTFEWNGFTVGLQTCYDIRFPEVSRWLVDAGANLIVVPAEWVNGELKQHHWRTLLTARAIENTVYVAAADHTPPIGVGNSMVVDPMGIEVATIGDDEGFVIAWPTPQRITEVRQTNPSLLVRRFRVAAKN